MLEHRAVDLGRADDAAGLLVGLEHPDANAALDEVVTQREPGDAPADDRDRHSAPGSGAFRQTAPVPSAHWQGRRL